MRVLVTGSSGLVGSALTPVLRAAGYEVVSFDIRGNSADDICDATALAGALASVDGVVHLAAVSRVVWAEREPRRCYELNQLALASLVSECERLGRWIVFASSREVYGQQSALPVAEATPLAPMNVYARSKVFGETRTLAARATGVAANVVRLSSVYGSVFDHSDRLLPAFARTAALGGTIRIEGSDNCFDLTHVADVARGLLAAIERTAAGVALPPIHLVTGVGTTLADLALRAEKLARAPVVLKEYPPRTYDVARFVGDPRLAQATLGWRPEIDVAQGFAMLVADFVDASKPRKAA